MFGKERLREFAEARFAEAYQGHERGEGARHCGHGGHDREERHFGRHGWGGWEGFAGRGGRGFGGFGGPDFGQGRERMFDSGELRLVILALVAEKPSYGYEIIKAIEERLSGGYAPSPGVVYPTLTLLEEEGFATVSNADGGKKLYTVTEQGAEYLKTNQATIKAIFGRMEKAGKAFGRGRSPQLMRAIANLMFAMKMRAGQGNLSPEQVSKIVEALDTAARTIDEV
jgi:DNA-binding PadR family transcriptional regulator